MVLCTYQNISWFEVAKEVSKLVKILHHQSLMGF